MRRGPRGSHDVSPLPRILFVDDEPNVLSSYQRMLRSHRAMWEMEYVSSPLEAWQRIQDECFDVVVSDVRMPGMTGIELLDRIKKNPATQDIQVLVVTGEADRDLKVTALNQDAADLLNKPVNSADLVARIRSAVRTKEFADRLKRQNEELEQRVLERTAELNASRIDILWRLGKAAEFRDEETGNHVVRVGCYSRIVAKTLGLDDDVCESLFLAAPLHDMGKIGVSDTILLKPGKLTDDEWKQMRRHCEIGVAILSDESKFGHVASELLGLLPKVNVQANNPVIDLAIEIAGSHHEKWNGTGYPNGLVGEEIPLSGRIVAIADVYDALRSERPYKKPFSVEKSLDIISEDAGVHFDPAVVKAFFDSIEQICEIEAQLSDQPVEDSAPGVSFPAGNLPAPVSVAI